MTKLVVGPFNRVEGDLEVHLEISEGRVSLARVNAPLYRGFERMLEGRDPRDALTITPRICGICSISQSMAAARALGAATGVEPTPDGARVSALIHAVENAADHLTHFNLFFMPDFARLAYAGRSWHARAVERFTAMEGSAQREAVAARAELMHILGLLAGKWPHTLAVQPGGVTRAPGANDKVRILASLRGFRRYLERVLFGAPVEAFAELASEVALMRWTGGDAGLFLGIAADLDLASLGRGAGRYLSFGAYPTDAGPAFAAGVWEDGLRPIDASLIREDLSHSWMLGPTAHPEEGQTVPDEEMREAAYSWCKAPRLGGLPMETGALARQVVDGHPLAQDLARQGGVLARVAGRLLELARTQILMERLAQGIDPAARFMAAPGATAESGVGAGLVEAARGALGHWLRIRRGVIASYQIVAPTTWNFSPRDADGVPGPLEAALVGAPVRPGETTPVAVQHVVRSFDPCMVCTVH
ncbi:nickel-dependent hydrogenase large subunit [Cereibacter sphaeroides]|uniref:nickel-dependent hydrogenase large subunit n=1 Tax=Cereibacter sphaeroides TaxID=1063 RepID=UPI001F2F0866|nr:nickel-dependent hydrogenase large subunit [Cereibacter sphaeroides]MCE6957926.1 nickel-dependent hydrogenase large subunit [Cereibacter sphaeroides]MCE6972323.1 nickel-dependent hydrogenase large subunit [Cereibacter sphaeroides]